MDKGLMCIQRLLEQRAAACHMDTCWGPLPATNHHSYTFRQSLYIQTVCSQLRQKNTGKHTEDYSVWQPQNLNGTNRKRKSKTLTDSLLPYSWMSTKAWDIAQGSFNVLNPAVYFCKIITVKVELPTGAPRRSLSVWLKLYNRSSSGASPPRRAAMTMTCSDKKSKSAWRKKGQNWQSAFWSEVLPSSVWSFIRAMKSVYES